MYVRVTRARFDSSKADEIQRLAQEQLIPAVRQRPGFRSYQGGLNREAGTLVAISMWDTREQAEGLTSVRAPFEALGVQFDASEVFEITIEA